MRTSDLLREAHEHEGLLELHIAYLTGENALMKSLLDSFWTGDVPSQATLDHMVLAKAGRQRLEEKAQAQRCALLCI